MHRPRAAASRAQIVLLIVGFALGLGSLTGCNELGARTLVQKANALYEEQEYEKAIAKYEKALEKSPNLGVIHHNLGLCYARLFRPGLTTPDNKAVADKASEHLGWWLERHPKDTKVRKFLINLWIEAGEYQRALDYYMSENQKDPSNREMIQKIASIYLAMTDWRSAVDWLYKDLALAPDQAAKLATYTQIARVAFNKLWSTRTKVTGVERTEIAEVGLQAAAQGLALDDKHLELTSISQGLWNNHAVAQGQYWAASIDRAESQVFEQRARVLREEAKKNQPPAPGAPGAPGMPVAPGSAAGSGS